MNQQNQRILYYKKKFQDKKVYSNAEEKMRMSVLADESEKTTYEESEELYLYAMIPVLMEYVTWVIKDAIAAGKKRLYFLARDGYQMYLAAKAVTEKCHLDIECRYLSVSRFAMRVPEYHLLGEQCLDRICVSGIDVTFEKICKRAALSEEELMEVAVECGWEKDFRRVLNYQEVIQLKETFRESKILLPRIYKYSKEAYPAAIGYLRQEGLFEEVPFALVDSGWIGTLQQTIQNLLRNEKPEVKVEGYYFGMYEYPKEAVRSQYHTFYFSPIKKLKRKVHFSNCLFEAIFSAPEGMTLGYQRENERYRPILDLQENPNADQLKKNIKILKEFLESYEVTASEFGEQEEVEISEIADIIQKFMGNPTETEVKAYGGTLFSDDVLEDHLQKVSAELSQEEIRKQRFLSKVLIMAGIRKDVIHESAWIEGSIINSGVNTAMNLRHAHFYKYFIYIRKRLQQGGKN